MPVALVSPQGAAQAFVLMTWLYAHCLRAACPFRVIALRHNPQFRTVEQRFSRTPVPVLAEAYARVRRSVICKVLKERTPFRHVWAQIAFGTEARC